MIAARPGRSGRRPGRRGASRSAAAGAIAVLLLAAPAARASCCIFEDPLLAIGDVAARSGTLRLALDTETLSSSAGMAGADGMQMRERVRQATLRTVLVYSPLERLNLVAAVPVVRREWRASGGGMEDAAALTGMGDVDLGARLALWRRVEFVQDPVRIAVTRAQAVAVTAGTSVPTGEDDARRGGVRLEEHAQLGTGAWGPYAGVLYELQREPWAVAASATARLRTTNAHGYRFGSAVLTGADVQHDVLARVSASLGADLRFAAPDVLGGTTVASTGGWIASATASASVGLAPGVRVRVRAALPVIERLRGDQRAGAAFVAGFSWTPG